MKKSKENKILNFEKRKFILLIGDEGAILTHIVGKKLQARLFATLGSESDLQKFRDLLAMEVKTSISILVDVADQTYTHQSLPAVSSFGINKLVKRRLERDNQPTDLKGSILLGRNKTGRNDWNFLFVSAPLSGPLADWLKFVIEQSNPFRAIYMLPIEIESLVKDLNKIFFSEKKKKQSKEDLQKADWKLFISHNKVGGFRQVALKNEKILFTRQINVHNDETPNFIAGTIEQEISNSFEYLKRLSLKDSDNLDMYIIVSKEIKNSLQKIKLKATNVIILTPFEASTKLDYKNSVGDEDKFGDILLSINFANNKPLLPFIPPYIKRLIILEAVNKFIYLPLYLLFPLVIIYLCYLEYNLFSLQKDLAGQELIKLSAEQRYNTLQASANELGDATKISDVISLYKLLSGDNLSPLPILKDFIDARSENILVKAVNWRPASNTSQMIPGSAQSFLISPINNGVVNENDNPNKSITILDLEFYNNDNNYQELFNNFDNFLKKLNNAFSDYDIQYSKLTEKISFNEINKIIPVQVTITGPKSKRKDS
jgi:hypothetical protein